MSDFILTVLVVVFVGAAVQQQMGGILRDGWPYWSATIALWTSLLLLGFVPHEYLSTFM